MHSLDTYLLLIQLAPPSMEVYFFNLSLMFPFFYIFALISLADLVVVVVVGFVQNYGRNYVLIVWFDLTNFL